jgi:hypothetical protein
LIHDYEENVPLQIAACPGNIYIFDNFYERIVEVDVSKGHGNKKH